MLLRGPYTDMFIADCKRQINKQSKRKSVLHHETCTCCGRKMVNLYLQDGEWKCKKCWDEIEAKETIANV